MFLTRSIRRKLVIGLGLVLLMLVLLGVAGFSGLWSYRNVVKDLQAQLDNEPNRSDLAMALAALIEPLMLIERPTEPLGPRVHKRQELEFHSALWTERFDQAVHELREYRRRIPLPSTLAGPRVGISHIKLDEIQQTLGLLERGTRQLNNTQDREPILNAMLRDVARLQIIVQELPNPERGFHTTLREAHDAYKWRLWLIGGCLVLVLPLLASLYWCGYVWIFVRVKKLHDAALRVANGDYRHRLTLPGRDEMVDLADSFNRMIDRFQRDKSESDREAQCRGEQIVRNKHLVDLGQMASGIAHEINNPLNSILLASDSLLQRLIESDGQFGRDAADRELLRAYLPMIAQAADRCQAITHRTLDIARGNNGPHVRYDLTKIVVEVLDRLRHVKGHDHITIEFDRSKPHSADVNPGELVQVVQNLVMNALEAMEGQDSGTVSIALDESVDEVILSVKDSGCGMTPHVLSHLYKPFFTERASGKGTGLGLSIVDRIVGEHGGRIEALSDGPGEGSTFRIHIPRRAQESAVAA